MRSFKKTKTAPHNQAQRIERRSGEKRQRKKGMRKMDRRHDNQKEAYLPACIIIGSRRMHPELREK
jgi:hypothetical protein